MIKISTKESEKGKAYHLISFKCPGSDSQHNEESVEIMFLYSFACEVLDFQHAHHWLVVNAISKNPIICKLLLVLVMFGLPWYFCCFFARLV